MCRALTQARHNRHSEAIRVPGYRRKYRVINLIKNELTHEGYLSYYRLTNEADHYTKNDLAAYLAGAFRLDLAHLSDHTR